MTPSELREKVVYRLDRYVQGARRDETVDAILRLIDEERDAARREAFENAAKVCEDKARSCASNADRNEQSPFAGVKEVAEKQRVASIFLDGCAAAIRALVKP